MNNIKIDGTVALKIDGKNLLTQLISAAKNNASRRNPMSIGFKLPSSKTIRAQHKVLRAHMTKDCSYSWLTSNWGTEDLTFYLNGEDLWCKIGQVSSGTLRKKVTDLVYIHDSQSRQTIKIQFENMAGSSDQFDATDRIIYLDHANRRYFKGMKEVFEWINTIECANIKQETLQKIFEEIDEAIDMWPDSTEPGARRLIALMEEKSS